jgi:hypothetical protein
MDLSLVLVLCVLSLFHAGTGTDFDNGTGFDIYPHRNSNQKSATVMPSPRGRVECVQVQLNRVDWELCTV